MSCKGEPGRAGVGLGSIARESGGFAMVALDQRESLRTMIEEAGGGRAVGDGDLVGFKRAAVGALAPHASAVLLDSGWAYRPLRHAGELPGAGANADGGCGVILAADVLRQAPGGPVEETGLDEAIDAAAARREGVHALKLLVIWRRDERREARVALAAEFVRRCRAAGLLSVLEGVARTGAGEAGGLNGAILEAASELSALRPSVYKAQVPGLGQDGPAETAAVCDELTARIPVPWVVLSQGVPLPLFPAAVELACRAGASGFLAGRAVWSDTLTDPAPLLAERSVPRLRALAATVDRYARPWWDATGDATAAKASSAGNAAAGNAAAGEAS
jgi:sulfofructosephosphate aldolase